MSNMSVSEALSFVNQVFINKPISPLDVCKEFGIRVVLDKPLNKDGYLVCAGGQKLIFVSSKITNQHRQSFIAAHEIGHFLLHSGQLYGCSNISETKALIINSRDQESEAKHNNFPF